MSRIVYRLLSTCLINTSEGLCVYGGINKWKIVIASEMSSGIDGRREGLPSEIWKSPEPSEATLSILAI